VTLSTWPNIRSHATTRSQSHVLSWCGGGERGDQEPTPEATQPDQGSAQRTAGAGDPEVMRRICRRCGKPTSERYFHAACGRAYEAEKSRRRRAAKGTTSQRGYGSDHQRLAKLAIARHPYCTDCGTTEDLCADHIVPTSKGGRNVLENYAVRCRGCNNARANRVEDVAGEKTRFF
jgi:5-methylcytosine-specific restriction endonuclease McrA